MGPDEQGSGSSDDGVVESGAGTWRSNRWAPVGRELTAADFAWRHRFVCVVTALHLPVLLAVAALAGGGGLARVGLVLAPGALLTVALLPAPLVHATRRVRAAAATLALLSCSAVLVQLLDTAPEARFHYFVAVAAIALYQDWTMYALALAVVAGQLMVTGTGGDWGGAAAHGGAVLAELAVLVAFWHANETARRDQERMRDALLRGQSTVTARIEETDRIRNDLIGTVSHEFRTPLTGIRAAALTLLKRGERLDDAGRARLLHAVLDQQERLSRLLENMLTAARATATDPTARAEVDAVAAEVVMLAGAARPDRPRVSVLVDAGTVARMDRQALHQVLANLVDNAQQHGADSAVPLLAGGRDERGVWLTVSNEGTTLDSATARTLFEPFTQLDSGLTRQREGLGMGLYVVRRLVEVYDGTVALRSEGGWTTVELWLPAADMVMGQRPVAV